MSFTNVLDSANPPGPSVPYGPKRWARLGRGVSTFVVLVVFDLAGLLWLLVAPIMEAVLSEAGVNYTLDFLTDAVHGYAPAWTELQPRRVGTPLGADALVGGPQPAAGSDYMAWWSVTETPSSSVHNAAVVFLNCCPAKAA